MKSHLIFILLLGVFYSCKKNVEISRNELYIDGGIKDELVIWKLRKTNSKQYPHSPTYKEKVKLKIRTKGITREYINGEIKYSKNGKPFKFEETLSLTSKNKNYYWLFEKPIDTTRHDIFPLKFESNNWYFINQFSTYGNNCYLKFYIDDKGQVNQHELEYVNLSPI